MLNIKKYFNEMTFHLKINRSAYLHKKVSTRDYLRIKCEIILKYLSLILFDRKEEN